MAGGSLDQFHGFFLRLCRLAGFFCISSMDDLLRMVGLSVSVLKSTGRKFWSRRLLTPKRPCRSFSSQIGGRFWLPTNPRGLCNDFCSLSGRDSIWESNSGMASCVMPHSPCLKTCLLLSFADLALTWQLWRSQCYRRKKPPLMQTTLLAVAKNLSQVAKNLEHLPSQKTTQPTHHS